MHLKSYRLLLAIAMCFLAYGHGYSQKYDYNYLYKTTSTGSGVSIQFKDSLEDIVFERFEWEGTVSGSPVLSDKLGEFLGYFNSRRLYDSIGRVSINGDSLAVGFFQNYFFKFLPDDEGLGNGGNCAFIPINDSLFYLFYSSAELWTGAPDFAIDFTEKEIRLSSYAEGLYLTKVRLNANRRLYILPDEKEILLIDGLFQYANLMFCKQANNNGWWLIIPNALNSKATRLSIGSDGEIVQFDYVEFSNNFWRVRSDIGFDFSANGKYLTRILHRADTIFEDILELYKFDRCEGTVQLLDVDSFPIPKYFTHRADVKFSDENNLLYLTFGSFVLI